MNCCNDRRSHSHQARNGGMEVSGPSLDDRGKSRALVRKGLDVAAHAEIFAPRAEQYRADIVALAQLDSHVPDFTAEDSVDRVAALGGIEDNTSKAAGDCTLYTGKSFERHGCRPFHLRCNPSAPCRCDVAS